MFCEASLKRKLEHISKSIVPLHRETAFDPSENLPTASEEMELNWTARKCGGFDVAFVLALSVSITLISAGVEKCEVNSLGANV